jgi:serine/threonine-protein kinase
MAVVYLAEDTSLVREVALKSLSPQYARDVGFRERFQREGRILARVRHESIVPVFDFGEQDDVPYIVMEYMPAGTLAERLERSQLSVSETLEVLRRVASALDAAHAAGVVHRDLKPANILFDEAGRAFVADFGVGRMDGASTGVTLPGTVIGTAQYMSPEQVNGAPPTAAADIYSFGALAYEALLGQAPFRGDTVWAIMRQHLEDPVTPPGNINPSLSFADGPLLSALAKDPGTRPPHATDVTRALDAGYEARNRLRESMLTTPAAPTPAVAPVERSPAVTGPRARRSAGKTLAIAIAGGAIVAGGVAVALALLLAGGDDDDGGGAATKEPSETSASGSETASETATETEAPTEAVTVFPPGQVVLRESFDDPATSQFQPAESGAGRGFIEDGRYYVEDASATDDRYAPFLYDVGGPNHSIGVDAFAPGGTVLLTCRGDDRFDVRYLVDQRRQQFRIQVLDKRVSGISTLVDWTKNEAIRAEESNRLELICSGGSVKVAANTVQLSEQQIPGVEGSTVSFGVDGGVQGTFDNVEIRME